MQTFLSMHNSPQWHCIPPSYDAIRYLLSQSLEASLIEDADKTSPLKYTITSEASMGVLDLLLYRKLPQNLPWGHFFPGWSTGGQLPYIGILV